MSVGPLRRFVGMAGLLALVPTAVMLGLGRVTLGSAALRAAATLLAAMLIGRLAGWWVGWVARGYERDYDDEAYTEILSEGAGRRRTDVRVPS